MEPTRLQKLVQKIRPANMRTVHGIQVPVRHHWMMYSPGYSVSCVHATEDDLIDHLGVAASGGGMDASETIPTGSVKVFNDFMPYGRRTYFGFCQRTVERS